METSLSISNHPWNGPIWSPLRCLVCESFLWDHFHIFTHTGDSLDGDGRIWPKITLWSILMDDVDLSIWSK